MVARETKSREQCQSTSKRQSSSSRFLPRRSIRAGQSRRRRGCTLKSARSRIRAKSGHVTKTTSWSPQFSRQQKVLLTNVPARPFPEDVGDDAYTMIVADGMGGMAAGEVASRMAITTGLKLFQKSPKWGFKINKREARELFDRVNGYLHEIDLELTKRSEDDRQLFGMGTTLTAAYSIGVDLFIIHLGDSRAYLFRDGDLLQLTKDHTVAQAMADAGYIAPEEVRYHNKRNVLTNFLGGHDGKVKADVRWLRLRDADRLLLCSDGLNDMVDDQSIAGSWVRTNRPATRPSHLLEQALERGGRDNVTVDRGPLRSSRHRRSDPPRSHDPAPGSVESTDSLEVMSSARVRARFA